MLGAAQRRVVGEDGVRHLAGQLEGLGVGDLRHLQGWEAALASAPEFAGSPEAQVLFGQPEAVVGGAEGGEAFGGVLALSFLIHRLQVMLTNQKQCKT